MRLPIVYSARTDSAKPFRGRPVPAVKLHGRTVVGRMRNDLGHEYLTINIRKPLSIDDVSAVAEMLDTIDPGNPWVYSPASARN
jgi:hypothetical protein